MAHNNKLGSPEPNMRIFRARFIPSNQFLMFLLVVWIPIFAITATPELLRNIPHWSPEEKGWLPWLLPLWFFLVAGTVAMAFYCYAFGTIKIIITPETITMDRLDSKVTARWEEVKKIRNAASDAWWDLLLTTSKGDIYIPENIIGLKDLLRIIDEHLAAVNGPRIFDESTWKLRWWEDIRILFRPKRKRDDQTVPNKSG